MVLRFPRLIGATAALAVSILATGLAYAAADADWPVFLGDAGATQYSTLDQITPENVSSLEVAWTYHAGGGSPDDKSQIQCNPLVVDGVLYGTSPDQVLFALDAATGRELWRFDPYSDGHESAGRGLNRGLVMWREGKEQRLLYTAGPMLMAVDPETGKLIKTFGSHGRVNLLDGLDRDTTGLYFTANTPGAVFEDLLIVSGRVSEGPGPAAPGHIRAFDVRTGERRWIFHTIPHPGEFGYDTWPQDAWRYVGGANAWAGVTIDHERGLAFLPTGSAAFDFYGGDRIGDNLFANCLLALDARTGERRWHFQFVHHDLWDRDLPAAPVLAEIKRDGKRIPVVVQTTKSGHVWVFHRETGESMFPWSEVPVPASTLAGEIASPTQPIPDRPAPFARQVFSEDLVTDLSPESHAAVLKRLREVSPHRLFDPPSERGTIIFPGFDGGAEWGGAAMDPEGILYVNSNEMAWILEMVPARWLGENFGPQALYQQLCMGCHGVDRQGSTGANIPSLVDIGQRLKPEEIAGVLRTGRGMMPSFGFLSEAQRAALVEFLISDGSENPASTELGEDPTFRRSPWGHRGYNRFFDPDGYPAVKPPWGTLNAIDLNTGDYLWTVRLGERPELTARGIPKTGTENYGGPVVTAGGVIFIAATNDEMIRAFDRKTGEELWKAQLPAGGYATPATYSVGGRQFVVIACGGGKMGTKSGDAYLAFALPES